MLAKKHEDCYCQNIDQLSDTQKRVVSKELCCSFCLNMFVRPVTLNCGHTFCQYCLQSYFLRNNLSCGICRSDQIFEHPLDLKVNFVLDSISRQLNQKQYIQLNRMQGQDAKRT